MEPQGTEPNVHVHFGIPHDEAWSGYYRVEVYGKGPWSIHRGGDWYTPVRYTGKFGVFDASGELPIWGDVLDPELHYEIDMYSTLKFQDHPWDKEQLTAIAYKMGDDYLWHKIAMQSVSVSPGHRHKIQMVGSDPGQWFNEPAQEGTKLIIGIYTVTKLGGELLLDKAVSTTLCRTALKRIMSVVQSELHTIAEYAAGRLFLEVMGTVQHRVHKKYYEYTCYHGNKPDMTTIADERFLPLWVPKEVPDVQKLEARLWEKQVRLSIRLGGEEKRPL